MANLSVCGLLLESRFRLHWYVGSIPVNWDGSGGGLLDKLKRLRDVPGIDGLRLHWLRGPVANEPPPPPRFNSRRAFHGADL